MNAIEAMKEKKVVKVDPEKWRRLKVKAAEQGRPLHQLHDEALAQYLGK